MRHSCVVRNGSSHRCRAFRKHRNKRLPFQPLRCRANVEPETSRQPDQYEAAALRLQSLLTGVGDGETEMLNTILEEEHPAAKILLSCTAGALVMAGSCAICWLCGKDPWGGASLSLSSLEAAAVGAVAALPVVAFKLLLWSVAARRAWPELEDVQHLQAQYFRPILKGLTSSQVALVLFMDVLPTAMMVLPAAQGGLTSSMDMYFGVLRSVGWAVPDPVPSLLALAITACLAAIGRITAFSIPAEQTEVVKAALSNADRYYRLMEMGVERRGDDAHAAAKAFKAVARTWLGNQTKAVSALGMLAALDVFYMGALWYLTGDLTAPVVCTMLASAVDFDNMQRMSMTREI